MLNGIRSVMVVVLSTGLMWGCGGERGMESSEVAEQIGRPLSKVAVSAGDMSQAMVVATVSQDDAPCGGCDGRICAFYCRAGARLSVVGYDG